MKKLILFIAFALLFTIFSCTPDEYESQPKKDTEKAINHIKTTYADDGPGDKGNTPPPPVPKD